MDHMSSNLEDYLEVIFSLESLHSEARAKDIADAAKDNGTSGLIDTWTDEAERRAWFLYEVGRTD